MHPCRICHESIEFEDSSRQEAPTSVLRDDDHNLSELSVEASKYARSGDPDAGHKGSSIQLYRLRAATIVVHLTILALQSFWKEHPPCENVLSTVERSQLVY